MKRVTASVAAKTKNKQEPERLSRLKTEFYFVPAALSSGVLAPTTSAPPDQAAAEFAGVWRGQGHQLPSGTATDWSIEMTIQVNGGNIEYPSLGCGGLLTQVSKNGTSAKYLETITHGDRCINGGLITVNFLNGKLAWTWVGSAGGIQYTAIALLTH
ncbi:MAG: hypothetical protein ACLPKB_33000 [Xanthobacteraceae bacterium]